MSTRIGLFTLTHSRARTRQGVCTLFRLAVQNLMHSSSPSSSPAQEICPVDYDLQVCEEEITCQYQSCMHSFTSCYAESSHP